MSIAKFIAFIPVRGGSKSIPLKNIKPLCRRPLVWWVLDAAVNCPLIAEVFISTDSDAIWQTVEEYQAMIGKPKNAKVRCIRRGPATASDTAATENAMLEFAAAYDFEHILLLQATSPLLQSHDLERAITKYQTGDYDSLLSVVRQKRFIWEETGKEARPVNYQPLQRPRRQDFDGFLVENGAFYITKKELLLTSGCRLSGKTGCYEMEQASYYELDEPEDWMIVESLLRKREEKISAANIRQKLKKVKLLATDCDGVLTDGGMYYAESGVEIKKFNTRDGMAINILRDLGIKTAIISGENAQSVRNRARKLGIVEVHTGAGDKVAIMKELLQKYGLTWDQVAYVGDDQNDLELLKKTGVSFAPGDAILPVKNIADFITNAVGGRGVIREITDLIIQARDGLDDK